MEIHTQQTTSPSASVLWQNINEGGGTVLDGRRQHQTEPVGLLPLQCLNLTTGGAAGGHTVV